MAYFLISGMNDFVTKVSEPQISDPKFLTICIAIGRTIHSTRYMVSESSCKTTYILITCQAYWHCILIYLAGLRAKADLVTMSATIVMLSTYLSLCCTYLAYLLLFLPIYWHCIFLAYVHVILLIVCIEYVTSGVTPE